MTSSMYWPKYVTSFEVLPSVIVRKNRSRMWRTFLTRTSCLAGTKVYFCRFDCSLESNRTRVRSKEYLKPNSCFECRLKSDKDFVCAIFFFATLIDIYITEWIYNSAFKIKQGNQFIVSFILKQASFLEVDGLTKNCENTQIKKYNKTYIKAWNLALLSNFELVNLHGKFTDPSITSFCLNTTHERRLHSIDKQN